MTLQQDLATVSDPDASPDVPAARSTKARWSLSLIVPSTFLVLVLGWSILGLPLPHSPDRADPYSVTRSPSRDHLFGTDSNGYDLFSRIIAAARNDVLLAASGVAIAAIIGTLIGIALSREGRLSGAGMRVLDLFQSLPLLIVAITLIGLTNGSTFVLALVIVLVNLPLFIRLVRGEALVLRRAGFISVAKTYGVGEFRIAWRHLVPNCSGVILPQISLSLAGSIITISGLGFLGLQKPGTASWGTILNSGVRFAVTGQWWISFFPAVTIFLVVLSFSELSFKLQALIENPMNRGD